jgi:hypothetical protein
MVTLAVLAPELALGVSAALEDALAAADELDALDVDSDFLSSLEQPDRPATRTAAPATATTKPRFTEFLLC